MQRKANPSRHGNTQDCGFPHKLAAFTEREMDAKRLRGALELVGEVAGASSRAEYFDRAFEGLLGLIPGQSASFNEWDFGTHRLSGFYGRSGFPPELAHLKELWPQCEWLLRMGPQNELWQTHVMSDRVTLSQLRRREVYARVYRPLTIDHFLTIPIAVHGQREAVLLVDRDRTEFAEDDRAVGNLVMLPLARLYRSIRVRERLAARLADVERTLASAEPARVEGVRLLTLRELEVLEHVAAGRTDREIATLLYLSPRTVHKHLQHVYEKLGVKTRTAAAMAVFGPGQTRATSTSS
jgi:DNA-binding CsgD family transcriptional regulator